MTTEEKLQHFTMYAMEDAREKSDSMLREYTEALEKIFREHQETKRRQEDLEIRTETERLVRENNKQFFEAQIEIKKTLKQTAGRAEKQAFRGSKGYACPVCRDKRIPPDADKTAQGCSGLCKGRRSYSLY